MNDELTICAGLLAFPLSTPGGGEGRGEAGAARTGLAPPTPSTSPAVRPSSPCPLLPEGGRRGNEISIQRPGRASPDCPAADSRPRRDREAGFTLLEILVVIAILGLLIGLVAPAALRQLGSAKNSVAHQSIERLGSVLDLYDLDVGSYPTTEQGLQSLIAKPASVANWNGPYLKGEQVPVDPWNRPYEYRNPSLRPNHPYDLCSTGPNGDASGDARICNP